MDDLENLRKRAKQLVRQHRDGVYVVADRLRRSLPSLEGMTDAEVLAADFALHDAQQVIATELGFASWADLKETTLMTTKTTVEQRFERATACVFTTDVQRRSRSTATRSVSTSPTPTASRRFGARSGARAPC